MNKCGSLAKSINKCNGFFHKSKSTTDGERTVTYSETWIPGMGTRTNCHGRPATDIEKELYKYKKKKRNYIMNCAIHEGESPSPLKTR